ncbi:hypothetical protein H4R18_005912, partial [Coemansia javaensis]
MTERKRRPEDGQDMGAQPPPTLAKKRHTAKENDFQALSAEFEENAAMLDLDSIRAFQKEAIWRQMQEYKRDSHRATQRAAAAERRQALWEERVSGICVQWDRAVSDIGALVASTKPAAEAAAAAAAETAREAWLEIALPRKPPGSSDAGPDTASASGGGGGGGGGSSTDGAQLGLERFNRSVNTVLRQLQAAARSQATGADWAAAAERLLRSHAARDSADELKAQVDVLSRRLSESKEALEEREEELRRALKRLDRRLCPT